MPQLASIAPRIRRRQATFALGILALAIYAGFDSRPSEAAFPGLNGRITCEGLRGPALPSPNPLGLARNELFSINPDGTGETVLTNNQRRDSDPAYSPDGTKIAFASERDTVSGEPANYEIYVANNDGDLEGPDVRRLTFAKGERAGSTLNSVVATDRAPTWSPDGTQIVFHSAREVAYPGGGIPAGAGRFEIYKISSTQPETVVPVTRLTSNRAQDAIPHWSPDGSRIVFQSLRTATTTTPTDIEVFSMNPDGTNPVNISQNPGSPDDPATTTVNENSNGLDARPQWSPDSRHIVFDSTRDNATAGNQNTEIYRMTRSGENSRRLTLNLSGDSPNEDRHYDATPSWSPDGRRIVFSSGRESAGPASVFLVYTMDADLGESAGLQPLAETLAFAECDWQTRRATVPTTYPLPRGYALPATPFAGCPAATANIIRGTLATNSIVGTPRADRIFAGAGDDTVDSLAGDDCVDLGSGADRGQGGDGADLIVGGTGADRMTGNLGNDRLRGGTGNDRLIGAFGNDSLQGQAGSDRINGERGRDRIAGGSSRDVISAGSSADRVTGDSGDDSITGNSGNDSIQGNSGRDRIKGSSGRDRLAGGSGADRISARDKQRDRINCGSGRDRVVADRIDRVARNCERVRRR